MTNIWEFPKIATWLTEKDHVFALSECQYNFLVQQFQTDDTDGDLHISLEELSDVLEGLSDDEFSESRCAEILSEFDLDHNGTIEFHEFVLLVLSHNDFGCIRKALTNIDNEHRRYITRRSQSKEKGSAMSSRHSDLSDKESAIIPKTPFHSMASGHRGSSFSSSFTKGLNILGQETSGSASQVQGDDTSNNSGTFYDVESFERAVGEDTLQLRHSSERLPRVHNATSEITGTVSILRNSTMHEITDAESHITGNDNETIQETQHSDK